MRRAEGPFTASAEIVAAKTDSGLIEFMKELNAIRDTVPTDELNKAKRYLQLGLPADFETTQQIATALVPVALYDLPLDYYNNYVQSIEGITQADVQRVAKQYVNPGSLRLWLGDERASSQVEGCNQGQLDPGFLRKARSRRRSSLEKQGPRRARFFHFPMLAEPPQVFGPRHGNMLCDASVQGHSLHFAAGILPTHLSGMRGSRSMRPDAFRGRPLSTIEMHRIASPTTGLIHPMIRLIARAM